MAEEYLCYISTAATWHSTATGLSVESNACRPCTSDILCGGKPGTDLVEGLESGGRDTPGAGTLSRVDDASRVTILYELYSCTL